MPRVLLRTHAAVQDCEAHLTASSASGTEIEAYLTQYLVITLCAEMQQELYRLSGERAAAASDIGLSSFIAVSSRKVLRSIGKGEIANYIAMFGSDCKEKLTSQLTDSEVTTYNNAVNDRHEVAHNQGARISFTEFKNALVVAEKIVNAAAYSLGLGPAPTALPNPNDLPS